MQVSRVPTVIYSFVTGSFGRVLMFRNSARCSKRRTPASNKRTPNQNISPPDPFKLAFKQARSKTKTQQGSRVLALIGTASEKLE